MPSASFNHDSKYNVVLYGVEECRSGMSRSTRLESDLTSVVRVFSTLDSSIQSQSVRDCHRLGKFSPGASRPRPILVKFIRAADVSRIFSKRGSLSSPFFIKPDRSCSERVQASILMRERWHLIQSGLDRKNIRIRGDSLYVNRKLHGRVSNSKFELSSAGSDTSCLSQPNSPKHVTSIVLQDPQQHIHVHTSPDKPTTPPVNHTCPNDTSFSGVDTRAASGTPSLLTPDTQT